MPSSTHFHRQLLGYLRQYSQYCDLRHLKAKVWMVSALICSGQLSLPAWEPYVPSSAQKAQSVERRWRRFLDNERICVLRLYVPLVLTALSGWQQHRIYFALDTTVLWNRYCMIHLSVVCWVVSQKRFDDKQSFSIPNFLLGNSKKLRHQLY